MPVQAWKPLLIIVPAGLMLGAIGGHYARPEMKQNPDDGSLKALFQTRAERNGTPTTQAAPEDATYYSGGYSYPPYLDDRMIEGDREITGWQGLSFADSPEYKPAPMPSVAQLEAQVAARDAALGQRAWGGYPAGPDGKSAAEAAANAAADAAAYAADESRSAGVNGPATAQDAGVVMVSPDARSTEPRTADGNLPAIW